MDSQGGDHPQRDLGARRQEMGQGEVLRWSPALHFACIVIVPVKKVRISSYVQVSLDKILVKALFFQRKLGTETTSQKFIPFIDT